MPQTKKTGCWQQRNRGSCKLTCSVKEAAVELFCFLQPDELGDLEELTELWLDSNMLTVLPDVGQVTYMCMKLKGDCLSPLSPVHCQAFQPGCAGRDQEQARAPSRWICKVSISLRPPSL